MGNYPGCGCPPRIQEAAMMNPLDFDDLKSIWHRRIDQLPEHRKPGPNTRYTIKDAALSASGLSV